MPRRAGRQPVCYRRTMGQINFEQVYQDYYNKIYMFVKKRIPQEQDAEELTADIFTAVYKNLERYEADRGSLDTWIYVITGNRIKNYYRDKKDEMLTDRMEDQIQMRELSAEEVSMLRQEREHLLQCLKKLSVRERSIIILKYYQGKNSEEIGWQLGLTPVNVRVILKRSLNKLRNIMTER